MLHLFSESPPGFCHKGAPVVANPQQQHLLRHHHRLLDEGAQLFEGLGGASEGGQLVEAAGGGLSNGDVLADRAQALQGFDHLRADGVSGGGYVAQQGGELAEIGEARGLEAVADAGEAALQFAAAG